MAMHPIQHSFKNKLLYAQCERGITVGCTADLSLRSGDVVSLSKLGALCKRSTAMIGD